MEILWLAIILYSAGLALILHFRPALMFNDDGTWKEFGYQRSARHTLLPFWLFVIAWAFVSYAIAAAFSWTMLSGVAVASASASPSFFSESESESDDDIQMTSASSMSEQKQSLTPQSLTPLTSLTSVKRGPGRPRKEGSPQPGYYVREDTPTENGLRRYIYYGPEAPEQVPAIRLPNATP